MRRFALAALLLCVSLRLQAQDPEILTNKAVIDMVVGKLPKDLIMLKVKGSKAAYDVSSSGLVALNAAKVPKEIIKVMMEFPTGLVARSAPEPAVEETPATPPSAPAREVPPSKTGGPAAKPSATAPAPTPTPQPVRKKKPLLAALPQEPGIHLHADDAPDLILEPTSYDGSKTSNLLGSALTGGLSKAKMKAVIGGEEAALRTSDPNVEFYFVFEKSAASLGGSNNSWYAALTSPNQFKLLRLDKKSSNREVTTASVGAFSAQSGTDEKAVVHFTFVRLKTGVYRVIPKEPLLPGEYAFFPAAMGGQGTAGAGMSQIFDFGVDGR
jgi:hypothetical protein